MRRFLKVFSTPTARSAAVYYFGSFALGLGRYFFHLTLLRFLLPSEYGEFLAYLSLLYLLGIPNATIANVVTKYVADFRGRKDNDSINRFFYFLLKKMTPTTLILGSLIIVFRNQLAIIFKAHPLAFVILGASVFVSLIGSLLRSYLNAFHRFIASIIIGALEILISIVLAMIFINAHLSASGAVLAQLLSGVISLVITFFILRRFIFPPLTHFKEKFKLGSFTGFSLIFAIGSLSLISTDVLVVRSVMTEHLSGIYSSLSIIGRSLYFALGPLIGILLPIAAHRHASSRSAQSVFLKLGGVMIVFGLSATLGFALFPRFIIGVISANYLDAANYLPLFGLTTFLFSLNIFIITYFMAIGIPQVNLFLALATLSQPLLIFLFHGSLTQVVNINLMIEVFLFLSLLFYLKKIKI